MSEVYRNEGGYLKLLSDILKNGVEVPDRTGVGSVAIFDAKIVFDCFPFFTHRKITLRLAFEEMWFFLRGETDTKILEEKGVNFWKGNTSREFLDNRGLEFLPEGDMGSAYSQQWRNSGGWYDVGNGVDQLYRLVQGLKENPYGRRHVVSLWNPSEEHLMPLTPCWWACQFVVLPECGVDTLHLKLVNRSLDILYGAPFALQQYRMLQMALANMLDMKVGNISADLSQIHIYNNQIDWAKETVNREWHEVHNNKIKIKEDISLSGIGCLLGMEFNSFDVEYWDYNREKYVNKKPKMAV